MFNRLFVKEVESETVETEIQSDDSSENEQVVDLHIRDRDKKQKPKHQLIRR